MPTGIQASPPSCLASWGALPFPADFLLRFRLAGGREFGNVRPQTTEGVQSHDKEHRGRGRDPPAHGPLSDGRQTDPHEHSQGPACEPTARAPLPKRRGRHGQWFFRAMMTKSRTSRSNLLSAVIAVASRSSPTLSS